MNIYADNVLVYQENWNWRTATGPHFCASSSYADQIFNRETIPFQHSSPTLTLTITSGLDQGAGDESFGFNSIQLVLSTCHYTCYTCSGSASNECLSCPPGTYLNPDKTCKSTCPASYIKNYQTGECVTCFQYAGDPSYQTCATCTGQFSTNCVTCGSGTYFDTASGTCMSPCPDQKYGSVTTQKCEPCYSPSTFPSSTLACATCNGPSATNCLSCPEGAFLHTDGTCIATCPSGYYFPSASYPNNRCIQCYQYTGSDGTCATCSGPNPDDCLSCNMPYYLDSISGKCVTTCPSGYWGDSSSNTCKLCYQAILATSYEQTCYRCTQGTSRDCTACVAGVAFFYAPNGTCLLSCPPGWWNDVSTNKCQKCYQYTPSDPNKQTCATCSGGAPDNCLSCVSPASLDLVTNTCIDTCSSGYKSGSVCVPCYQAANPATDINKSCQTCSGSASTNCNACFSGNYYYSGNSSCLGSCPNGFYADSTTGTCLPCYTAPSGTATNRTCVTCDGPASYNCLSCDTNAFLMVNWQTCLSQCPSGYYEDATTNTCMSCFQGSSTSEACESCTGPLSTDCTSCFDGTYFLPVDGTCVRSCPVIGWYAGVRVCLSCFLPSSKSSERACLTCRGSQSTDCLSCPHEIYYYMPNSTCLFNCPYGYFKDNSTFSCVLCTATNSSLGCPTIEVSSTIGQTAAAANAVNMLGSSASVFLFGGLSVPTIMAISFPADVGIFIYLSVGFPDNYVQFTRGILEKQNSLNLFSAMRSESQTPNSAKRGMFGFWETSSALFENSGLQIAKELITLLIIVILSILARLLKNYPKAEKPVRKCMNVFRWNGLISFLLQDFSNLILNSMIQLRENSHQNVYVGVSLGFACVVIITYTALIPFFIYLLNRKRTPLTPTPRRTVNIVQKSRRVKIPDSVNTISEGFKDKYWITRNFMVIYLFQYVLAIFTVFFVQLSGPVPPALYTTINLIYLLLLLGFRPIKSKLKLGVVLFNQICKSIMGILALVLGVSHITNTVSSQSQTNIGLVLIVLTLTGCMVDCLFSLVFLTITIFELLTTVTQKKKEDEKYFLGRTPNFNRTTQEQESSTAEFSRSIDDSAAKLSHHYRSSPSQSKSNRLG